MCQRVPGIRFRRMSAEFARAQKVACFVVSLLLIRVCGLPVAGLCSVAAGLPLFLPVKY